MSRGIFYVDMGGEMLVPLEVKDKGLTKKWRR